MAQSVTPALLVRDMAATLAFYEQLGFVLTGCHPDRAGATWAEICLGGATFQFHTDPPVGTPAAPTCSGTFYLGVEGVERLADRLRGRLEFAWGPEVMDYGMREFGLQDPNGYYIAFTEPVGKE